MRSRKLEEKDEKHQDGDIHRVLITKHVNLKAALRGKNYYLRFKDEVTQIQGLPRTLRK